jgi:hypothetical protein
MAYDEVLAERLRAAVAGEAGLSERQMFGGLAFLINGNLAVSASGQGGLMLRVPPEQTDDVVTDPHAERVVMQGRQMDGWVRVDASGVESDDALGRWVRLGVGYARTLPPKR